MVGEPCLVACGVKLSLPTSGGALSGAGVRCGSSLADTGV